MQLYVFGGVIIGTRLTPEGSVLEAMYVPVDRHGYFEDRGRTEGRFLALLPAGRGVMDPEVFTKGRKTTIAARFTGLKKDKIDEMDYTYPVFEIEQVYLWSREPRYYPAYYYDPWFYPYPYYYWNPWWSYPYYGYYYNDYYYRWRPPVYRRSPLPVQPPPSRSFKRPERQGLPQPAPGPRHERK